MKPLWPLALASFTLAACSDPGGAPKLETARVSDEAVIAEPMMSEAAMVMPESPSRHRAPRSGIVTAGDIDDTLNLPAFQRYLNRTPGTELSFAAPVSVQLTARDGRPAPGMFYTLSRPGRSEPFHSGYSGVNGMITAFPALLGQSSRDVVLRLFPENAQAPLEYNLRRGAPLRQIALPVTSDWNPDFIDMVLVVDATGSMGDELAWLEKDFVASVSRALQASGRRGTAVRYGLVVYRDRGDEFVVRNYGFTRSAQQMRTWLEAQSAGGGGDYPEAAGQALEAAVALPWLRGEGERLLLHVADAPAHNGQRYLNAAKSAAAKGVQVFTLGASGVGEEAEHLMRQASAATSGRYVFLTDDSGVGYAHAEPDVACYKVTSLRDKLQGLLVSELTGVRTNSGQVIREVGRMRNGVCLN